MEALGPWAMKMEETESLDQRQKFLVVKGNLYADKNILTEFTISFQTTDDIQKTWSEDWFH